MTFDGEGEKQHKNWLEKNERARIWATFEEAAKLVREPSLKRLFEYLGKEAALALGANPEDNAASNAK